MTLAIFIKRHYKRTGKLLGRLNGLVEIAEADRARYETKRRVWRKKQAVDPKAKTAVLFVNGFSGTGLHTLFTIMRVFSGTYKNFIFIQIGLIDSGLFKGVEEIAQLKAHIEKEADRYVSYMRAHGFNAESRTAIGVDVVDESTRIAAEIVKSYPRSIFFAGQLVFPEDTFFTRWLHNYSAFAIQRQFYHQGIPILILPIRL